MIDSLPSSSQNVDVIYQHSQTFRRPEIPHPRCADVPSWARKHPWRGTCAACSGQEHRGGGDPVGRWVGHSVSMYLPGRTGLPLECTFETVEGLDQGTFPDIRCGCTEAGYERAFGLFELVFDDGD